MGNPFTSPTISNYNTNPPADDGSVSEANRVKWSTIKNKLTDPPKTTLETLITNTNAAFGKVVGGAGVTSASDDYEVQSTDQGKLVRVTASGKTITTPDATSVDSPFVFAYFNASGGSITIDGSGTQTIDGADSLTIQAGQGGFLFTDGTNWFSIGGYNSILSGAQVGPGVVINGTIAESNATNAVTFAIKTLAGDDPSATDPVLIAFRNATAGTGDYVFRTVTAATSFTISSGSKLGASDGTAFRIWIVLFDDGGTVRIGAINCLNGKNIYPLGQFPIASSTAEGGSGGADSAQTFYTGTAVTSKPYLIWAYASYESGLSTAGSWNASPTRLHLVDDRTKLPGETIQRASTNSGAVATGTTIMPYDDTKPQNTEGDEYMTVSFTPVSAANVFEVKTQALLSTSAGSIQSAIFRDSAADALGAEYTVAVSNALITIVTFVVEGLLGSTSSTTFKLRAGPSSAATVTFNGTSGSRKFGGVANSLMIAREIMA